MFELRADPAKLCEFLRQAETWEAAVEDVFRDRLDDPKIRRAVDATRAHQEFLSPLEHPDSDR